MANRFPLVVDTTDNNKIKELPVGDNLNLAGSGIVNAGSIQTDGTLTAYNLVVNGQQLSTVAFSGDYADLNGAPTGFSGSYNDLVNKPTIPATSRNLTDVQDIEPADGNVLQWNAIAGRYEPTALNVSFDLGDYTLGDIGNVVVTGDTTNKYLKYYSGAWRAASITYGEILSTPTIPTALSQLTNDVGFITSETDSQTLSFEGTELTISGGNTVDLASLLDDTDTDAQTLSLDGTDLTISNGNTVDLSSIVGDSVGNFTFASSVIDTDDSSAITITPAVVMSSDLTVENDLIVNGDIVTTSTGTPEVFSETEILLTAADRVSITQSPFRLASFTTAERDELTAQNGDLIYNVTDDKLQGYQNGAWINIDGTV
jgi:hypothetical protein